MKPFFILTYLVVFLHSSQANIDQNLYLYDCLPEELVYYGEYYGYDQCFNELQTEVSSDLQSVVGSDMFVINFTIALSVTFGNESSEISLSVCEDYFYFKSGFNQFAPGEQIEPQYTANMPIVSALKPSEYSLQGKFHTLIMVETDVYTDNGSSIIIYWMKVNIEGGDFWTGEDLMEYYPVTPYEWENRQVVFMLFEQPQKFNDVSGLLQQYVNKVLVEGEDYIPPQLNLLPDRNSRALFELDNFVLNDNLVLVGATWYNTETNAYSVLKWLNSEKFSKPEVCCWINICCWIEVYDENWESVVDYERCDQYASAASPFLPVEIKLYAFFILLFMSIFN